MVRRDKQSAMPPVPESRILVGVIGAAHGIRGELRLKSYTAEPGAIRNYGPLTSSDGHRRFEIVSYRSLKDDMAVVRLKGVEDRASAEALTNTRLFIDRAQLPAPDEDEFYHADLIGLRAEMADGEEIGTVVTVQNHGAGDLVEIAPGRGETILVPFTKAFVPEIDLAGGRIVVAGGALGGDEDPEPETQVG